jgi:DNA-binding transcriptional regulator GbsR (MarR family)
MSDESPDSPTSDPVIDAALEAADLFGRIAEFWGFTRTQGRAFGLLYMSPEPLDQSTVRERLSISAGNASMTLGSLVEWGVLQRQGRLYVAETNFFALITQVMRQRESAEVEAGIGQARNLVARLAELPTDDARVAFARERAEHMLRFFETGRSFLEALVSRGPLHRILSRLAARSSKLSPAPFPTEDHNVH